MTIYDPVFSQEDLDMLAKARAQRRREWHAKVVHLNNEINAGHVKLPMDYPIIHSLAAVKTARDGMIDLSTLDSTAKAFANAVWDTKNLHAPLTQPSPLAKESGRQGEELD